MKFITAPQDKAIAAITKTISKALAADKRVLWLVSGGSNVAAEVTVMDKLRSITPDKLAFLAILPMDERYGHPGHADSNTQALRTAGFEPGAATWVDVLLHDVPFDQTISFYNDVAATACANADVIVGQFGLGTDGHVAGVLPKSPAASVDDATVAGYEWSDYTRLTLTPQALRQITGAYVLAYGEAKKKPLQRLQKHTASLATLPAVLLYDIKETFVYNDYIESEATK